MCYWIAAFTVALLNVSSGMVDHTHWWNIRLLREPGISVGSVVLGPVLPGTSIGYGSWFEWPILATLAFSAIGMGAGTFLLSAKIQEVVAHRLKGRDDLDKIRKAEQDSGGDP